MKKTIILISLVGIGVYANSLPNGFMIDDYPQIINNSYVQTSANIIKIFQGSTFFRNSQSPLVGNYYRPLMTVAFMEINWIFGNNPLYYHLVSVIWHVATSILVFLLLRRFMRLPTAGLLGLVFAIHPINTEAVDYASNLHDIMFVFFGLAALLLTVYKKVTAGKISMVTILMLLSLLSKETAILFFPLILGYVYKKDRKQLKYYVTGLGISGLVYLGLRYQAIGWIFYKDQVAPIMFLTWQQRLINVPLVVFTYLKTFFWPVRLIFQQKWIVEKANSVNFFWPFLADLAVIGAVIRIGILKAPVYWWFAAWGLMGLAFHAQIVPLDITVADRYFYFTQIGILGLLGILSERKRSRIWSFLGIIIICGLAARTVIRNTDWHDEMTLVRHDVQADPDNFVLQATYGFELMLQGDYDKAEIYYNKSFADVPNVFRNTKFHKAYWLSRCNNYQLRAERDNLEEDRNLTIECYQNETAIYHDSESEMILVKLLLSQSRLKEAEILLMEMTNSDAKNAKIWGNLALVELQLGKKTQAVNFMNRAYSLDPNYLYPDLFLPINRLYNMATTYE